MKNLSKEFRQKLDRDERDYLVEATITLQDNTVLNLTNSEIWSNGFSYEEAVSNDDNFDALGSAVIGSATLIINNIYGTYSPYDFTNASVIIYLGMDLNEPEEDDTEEDEEENEYVPQIEKFRIGTYTVDETNYNGGTIKLSLLDNLVKFDKPYSSSNLVYPATLYEIVADACVKCGVELNTVDFPHKNYEVSTRPSDQTTFREVISWAATIAGCFIKCDTYGRLKFNWFDITALNNEFEENIDGGIFDNVGLSSYLNTENGMEVLTDTKADDKWYTLDNTILFTFDSITADTLYIDSDSCYIFTNTAPSSHGHSTRKQVNVCTRDGRVHNIKYQYLFVNETPILKIRWDGYTRYGSYTDGCKLTYEIFFIQDGKILINFITLPTDSAYIGTSSIIENGTSYTFTPSLEQNIYAQRSENGWSFESIESIDTYESGDTADGGTFNPWDTGDEIDGGAFYEVSDVHQLRNLFSQNINMDDVVITGIAVEVKVEAENSAQDIINYTAGTSGYVIRVVDNPFITTDTAQTVANWLGTQLIGLQFRKMSISQASDPSIESGDVAIVIDRKLNIYRILITRMSFAVSGNQTIVCGAETPLRNSATRFSAQTKSYVESKKLVKQEATERQQAVNDLTTLINTTTGLHTTIVQPQGGGNIYYMHDKPTLADSKIVWKMTADAWAVTKDWKGTDAATTAAGAWVGGMTIDGTFIASIINTITLFFDYAKGGTLTLGGSNDINGKLRILNASGSEIGKWDNTGITINGGRFQASSTGDITTYGSLICYESYVQS